jgi:hypothetical protein
MGRMGHASGAGAANRARLWRRREEEQEQSTEEK